jgi:LmeA-like phospholipid-binding
MVVAIVAVLLAGVLMADRVAVICAADRVARQIGDRGFSAKPHVTIAGFPFLTQVAARRLNKVVIRAEGKKLGPVEVKRLDLTLHGIRASYGGRTASRVSGTALVGFAGLARMTGTPGLTLSVGIPVAVLGPLRDITLPLPALPLGMTIQGVSVTGQGVLVHMTGQDVRFGS